MTWYKERVLHSISLGSVIVMVLVRTVQVNMAQIRVRTRDRIRMRDRLGQGTELGQGTGLG